MTEIERLYRAYFQDIFLYVKSLSGSAQTAEDITSETFFKAMKGLDSYKGTCDIRVWLCQIAKNCYYSSLRKDKRLVPVAELAEMDADAGPEPSVLSAEQSAELHAILHRLPEPYKEVFTLRVFGELSFRQIAQLFGKTENWACVTFHRAKTKIRERMEEQL